MRKIYLLLISAALFVTSCRTSDLNELADSNEVSSANNLITKSGNSDGVAYRLNNLEVNPDLVKISSKDAVIISSRDEMENGRFSFQTTTAGISEKLVPGNVILLVSEDQNYLRKITQVTKNNNNYVINTSEAYIGDLFVGGSLELSVDTQASEKAMAKKMNPLISAKGYNANFTYDIFQHIQDYTYGGFTLSPNTSVTSNLVINMGFGNSKIFPNQFEVYYQINSAINPSLKFTGAVNENYTYDLVNNVPANLLDLLKTVKVDINIPTGSFLGDIPATISVDKVNFPVNVEASLSKASKLSLSANGIFKIGFAYYNNVPGKTSHFIYENTMTNAGIAEADLAGEVSTDMAVVIKPKISLVNNNLINVDSNIILGVNSYSSGYAGASQATTLASKGNFYSKANFKFSSLGINLYQTDLFKENKELWNIGNFNNVMAVSNFRATKIGSFPCSGLDSYKYGITLDYKYRILGKKMAGDVEVTYDVYADNGALLQSGKKVTLTPSNVTDNSFTISLCVPFRKTGFFGYARTTFLRNVTIKDAKGYTATGIIDPATNQPYSQMSLTR